MATDYINGLMVPSTVVTGAKDNSMVKAITYSKVAAPILVPGKTIKCTEQASTNGPTAPPTVANTTTAKNTVLASKLSQINQNTKVNFPKASFTV